MKITVSILIFLTSQNQITTAPKNQNLSQDQIDYFDSITIFSGLNPNQTEIKEPLDQQYKMPLTSQYYAKSKSGLHHFKKEKPTDT